MKVFISYGHADHTQVVDYLFDALIREGHEPWKDDRYEGNSGIPAGRDFSELIYQTIDASDFVIAFVTNQTQNKPYCRDERQYAYNSKGDHFIQIRMDYVDITLGNARSYIDMSDVISSNGQINPRLFEEKWKALLAAFRDPSSFAEGGFTPWTKFDTHLKVPGALKYHEFIASLDEEGFVGRQWLLEKCKEWVMDETVSCRLFVILGEAGTGKTAFVRRLARDEELVRSVHICIYDKPSTRTARDTLKDLAYVLAQNNSSYFEFLKMKDFEKLRDMTIDGLFEFLFIEPLKTETQKYLMVIDGLDEMEESTGFKPLMRLFRQYADQLNPNISFLVTTRPDAYITDMLKTVAPGKKLESVILDKNASMQDLQCFIKSKLNRLGCYSQNLADKLLEACDGNFEYLSLLFREALEEGLQVFEGMKIPRGLNERYAQYLDRRMEMADCSRLSREQRRLLSLLCAAYEPVPISVLCAVSGLDEYDITDELELFGSLIRRIGAADKDPRICLFTKSFRDFLLGRHFEKYSADSKLGNRMFSKYLMDRCSSEKELKKHPYLDQYGFVHLLLYADEDPEAVTAYCKSLADSDADVARRIADALDLGDTTALHSYCRVRKEIGQHTIVIRCLKGKRNAEVLGEIVSIYEEEKDMSAALILEADMLLWNPTPELYAQAEQLYRKALEFDELSHQANPVFETRRALSISHNRLGDLMRQRQTPEGYAEAEQLYRKAMSLSEQNYRDNPCYEVHRDVSVSYNRLGDLARRKQTPEGNMEAEQWFTKAMDLCEQNHETAHSYESRRDLYISFNRLGDLMLQKQTPEGDAQAEQFFRKAMDLCEQNLQVNSCYESRRDSYVSFNRLGDLAMKMQTLEGNTEAEQWFLKMLEIGEQNHQTNPSYQTYRDLYIACSRLGDLAQRKQTPESNAEAELLYRKAMGFCEQNHQANPSYESRRDLYVGFNRLGDLMLRKQTSEGNMEAEQCYRESLGFCEQNHHANPNYESRRDLIVAYYRIADIVQKNQSPESNAEAEQWYKKILDLCEQNHHANPCYESRRNLAISYNRLGDLARQKQTPEGNAEAEQWYIKAMSLCEQNVSTNPGYESHRDLIIAYGRVGNMMQQKQTVVANAQAEQLYRKALRLCEQNVSVNPGRESRQDLILAYVRLGGIVIQKQTPDGNTEAEYCYRQLLSLYEQDFMAKPDYESRRNLLVVYNRLGDLAQRKQTSEATAEAEKWYQKMLEMCEQNHKASPCAQSENDLSVASSRLAGIQQRKGAQ